MYSKQCIICDNNFESRIDHKITCSNECRKKHQKEAQMKWRLNGKDSFNGNCLNCSNQIEDFEQNRRKRYCSEKCKNQFEYNNLKLENVCQTCCNKFESKRKSTKFCSKECVKKYKNLLKNDDIEVECCWCHNKFIAEYIHRGRLFCSKNCATSYNNSVRDEIAVRNKISKTLIDGYADGSIKHGFIGKKHSEEAKNKIRETRDSLGLNLPEKNPMFGKNHSKETKEKISNTRSEKIVNGEYNGWFKKGNYFSTKLNREIYYQSSWELEHFKNLDNDDSVIEYQIQPFRIEYYYDNHKRNYIPDLHILYADGIEKLIEIKPDCFVDAAINVAKGKAAIEYCKPRNILYEVWTQTKNPYIINFG